MKLCLFLVTIGFIASATAGEIAVIVNASNPEATLTSDSLKKIYLEQQLWGHGEKAKRFFQADNPALRTAMCDKLFGKTCLELDRHFGEMGYRNGLSPEKASSSAAEVVNMVKTFKGGIGLVDKASAKDPAVKEVLSVSY